MKSYTEYLTEFYTSSADSREDLELQLQQYRSSLEAMNIPEEVIQKMLDSVIFNWSKE
jgi:hypothetical protein